MSHDEVAPFAAFPTSVPTAEGQRILQAFLTKSFSKGLVEDVYTVIGYGLYLALGSQQGFGAHPDDVMTEEEMVAAVKKLAAPPDGLTTPTPELAAVPWSLIITIALKVIEMFKNAKSAADAQAAVGSSNPA